MVTSFFSHPASVLTIGNRTKETIRASLFFLVMLLVVYAPSFSGVWIYDDFSNIVTNDNVHLEVLDVSSLIKSLSCKPENPGATEPIQRPLAYLSFAINWFVGKDDVFGYHIVNFIIHLTTTCFLYLFIRSTLLLPTQGQRYRDTSHSIAFLSALMWAMHPIQVTAVTYIVQRMASMAGMFTIICLYFYVKGRTSSSNRLRFGSFIASAISALLALGTKQNSALLPITLFFYEFFLIQGVGRFNFKKMAGWGLLVLGVFVIIVLCYANPITMMNGFENRPYTPTERVLTESRVVLHYLRMLFYPLLSQFTLIHDFTVSKSLWSPWTTLASIIAIAGLILSSIFWFSKRHPIIAFSILFFFINHAIEGSFIALELIYEHRNYIPSMLLFLLPSMLVIQTNQLYSHHKKVQICLVICFGITLSSVGHTTYAYNNLFRHDLILWKDNAKKSPNLSVVHNNYGIQLMAHGYYEDAFSSFQNAIALDRYFNLSQAGISYYNMGTYYETVAKDQRTALNYYRKAVDLAFSSKMMWYALARSFLLNGEIDRAESLLQDGIRQWPDDPNLIRMLKSVNLVKVDGEAVILTK